MHKQSMPHEDINLDNAAVGGYDGLVECLSLVDDMMQPCPSPKQDKCNHCMHKIREYGFSPDSWAGYRQFMRGYDHELSYPKVMSKIMKSMPIWHRTENRLLGFIDRQTGEYEPLEEQPIEQPLVSQWIKKNCKFS